MKAIELPKILFWGKYLPKDINVIFRRKGREINSELEKRLQRKWHEILKEAERTKQKIWDAELYRLNQFKKNKTNLTLELSTVPYRVAISMNNFLPEIYNLGEDYFSKSIYTTGIIETRDNKFVFGYKSKNYYNDTKFDLIGGALSKSELVIKNSQDIFKSYLKELKEELGITPKKIKRNYLQGAILNKRLKIGFTFYTKLSLDEKELKRLFTENYNDELSDLIFIEKENILNIWENNINKRIIIEEFLKKRNHE